MRLAPAHVAAVAAAALALAAAATARADTFVQVPSTVPSLPSAQQPNEMGRLRLPPGFPADSGTASGAAPDELALLWRSAGEGYGIPWEILAAINKIESNFGTNVGPSSAGAIGPMQFLPSTWLRWGMDGDGDGVADPWSAGDSIYSAARYLAAAGGERDLERALFAYNHADWYVQAVLASADEFGLLSAEQVDLSFSSDLPRLQLAEAQATRDRLERELAAAEGRARDLAALEHSLLAQAETSQLLSERLSAQQLAVQAGVRTERADDAVARLRNRLAQAQTALDAATSVSASPFLAAPEPGSPPFGSPFGVPAAPFAFPVEGGAGLVSAGWEHHDYPAVDIAAPAGSPVVAHADGVVVRGLPFPEGRCGIGFTMLTGDGRRWTYCHLSRLEPYVASGVTLVAGTPVGSVGSTGRSTGPHLHLQLSPPTAYPQREWWFSRLAGTAFTWQDGSVSRTSDAGPLITFSTGPSPAPVMFFSSDEA